MHPRRQLLFVDRVPTIFGCAVRDLDRISNRFGASDHGVRQRQHGIADHQTDKRTGDDSVYGARSGPVFMRDRGVCGDATARGRPPVETSIARRRLSATCMRIPLCSGDTRAARAQSDSSTSWLSRSGRPNENASRPGRGSETCLNL